jgi:hypothetical protein
MSVQPENVRERTLPPYAELCMLGNKSLPLLQVFALLHKTDLYKVNEKQHHESEDGVSFTLQR